MFTLLLLIFYFIFSLFLPYKSFVAFSLAFCVGSLKKLQTSEPVTLPFPGLCAFGLFVLSHSDVLAFVLQYHIILIILYLSLKTKQKQTNQPSKGRAEDLVCRSHVLPALSPSSPK